MKHENIICSHLVFLILFCFILFFLFNYNFMFLNSYICHYVFRGWKMLKKKKRKRKIGKNPVECGNFRWIQNVVKKRKEDNDRTWNRRTEKSELIHVEALSQRDQFTRDHLNWFVCFKYLCPGFTSSTVWFSIQGLHWIFV